MNEDLKKQPSIVQLMGWPNRQYGSFERYLVQLSHALSDRGADSHFIFQNQSLSTEFIRDSSAQFHVVLHQYDMHLTPASSAALQRFLKKSGQPISMCTMHGRSILGSWPRGYRRSSEIPDTT